MTIDYTIMPIIKSSMQLFIMLCITLTPYFLIIKFHIMHKMFHLYIINNYIQMKHFMHDVKFNY